MAHAFGIDRVRRIIVQPRRGLRQWLRIVELFAMHVNWCIQHGAQFLGQLHSLRLGIIARKGHGQDQPWAMFVLQRQVLFRGRCFAFVETCSK